MEDQQQTASRGPEGVPKTADGAIQDAPPAQSKANATEASAAPHNASASASTSAPAVPPANDAANLEPATRGIDEAVDQDKTNAEPATAGMELATTTEPAPSSSSPSTTNAPPAVPSTNEEPATAGMDITLDLTPATAAEKVITGNNAEPATAGMDQAVPPAADNESLGPHQDTTGDAVVAQPPDASASASSANGNKDESNDTNMEPATDGMDLAATAATASIDNQNGKFPEAVPSAYTEKGAQQVHQNGNGDENGAGQGTADDKSNDARTDAEAANPPPVSSTGNPDFDELISKDLAVKIYIGGLPDHTEKGDLEDCFGQFGEIDHIQLKTGYAFIDYVKTGSAKAAIETYDGGVFLGETLKVEASRSTATQKKNVETNSCFTCGSRDHYARQCPKDPRNAGKLEGAYKPQYAHHRTRSPPPSRDGRDRDRDRDRERDFRPRDSRDRDLDRDRDRRDERYREPRRVDPRDDRDRERERDRGLDRGRYGDGPERRRSPPPYSRERERDRDFAREPDRAGARDPREDYASRDRDRRPYEPPAREPLHQSVRGDHRERDAPLSYRGGREEYDRSDRDRDYRRGAGPGEPSGAHFPPAGMPAPGYAPMGVPPYPPYDGMPPPAHLYGSEPPFYPGGSSDRGGGGAPPGFPPAHHFPPPAHMFAAGPGYIPQGAVPPLLPRGAFDPRGGPGAPTPSGYYGTIAGRGEEYPPPGASRLLDDRDRDRDRRDPGREREREPRPSVRDGRDERAVPPPPPVSARSSERDYRDPRERDEREAYYRREGGGAGGAPFPPRGYPVAGPEGGDRDRERARDRDREREREPMRERERVGYPPYGSLPPPGYPGFAGPESAFYPPPPSGRMLPPGVGAGAGAPPAYPPRFEPPMSAGSPRSSGPYRGRDDQDDRFHPYAGQPPPRRGERE